MKKGMFMNDFKENLKSLTEKYELIYKTLKNKNKTNINGRVEIVKSKYKIQYYHCYKDLKTQKIIRKYIPNKDIQLAKNLAQKSYDNRIEKIVKKRIRQLNYIKDLDENEIDDVYESLDRARQELIVPIIPTKSQKLQHWKNEGFIPGKDVIFTFESSSYQLNFRILDKLIYNMIK